VSTKHDIEMVLPVSLPHPVHNVNVRNVYIVLFFYCKTTRYLLWSFFVLYRVVVGFFPQYPAYLLHIFIYIILTIIVGVIITMYVCSVRVMILRVER
jgi:hypothetical protein